ncbi:maltose O-acetyltransferase [Nonomuraea solani]|uniref:Maltose O-acetyltransferase n=1 Tax=Nonomuraea solani TaxID=1144553 RepID=A0A1H6EWE3_9ACTN|nr:maltose O-acetyltransferase [Nonomuraea solani]
MKPGLDDRSTLAELLGAVGEGTETRPPPRVGVRSFAGFGLVALDVAPITIGSNAQLMTPTHPVDPELRRAKWEAARVIRTIEPGPA